MPGLKVQLGTLPGAAALRLARPCWRKVQHRSRGAADAHIRALRRLPVADNADRLESYACRHCGGWHVGHRDSSSAQGQSGFRRPRK